MKDRIITADASKVSGTEFFRAIIGDPNDITGCPRAGKYFLRDGAWWLVKPEHYTRDQLTETQPDPLPHLEPRRAA